MPDAHQGYGLPIGGVLATENAVIPYAVGVDIACRMKLSASSTSRPTQMKRLNDQLVSAPRSARRVFGTGGELKKPQQHDVLDEDWSVTPVTQRVFDKARAQLGTSGSRQPLRRVRRAHARAAGPRARRAGKYLALLTHTGSRGAGATVGGLTTRGWRWTSTRSCRRSCATSRGSTSTASRARNTGPR